MPELIDADLDALAPPLKRVKLGGKVWKLPGDMPMPLMLRIQNYGARTEAGEDETALLAELQDELLALFKVHQPTLKELPEIGVLTLLQSLGAIYGGAVGEAPAPNRAARRAQSRPAKKKTPSSSAPSSKRRATSR